MSATFFPQSLPKPRIEKPLALARSLARSIASRALRASERAARSGAELLGDYWSARPGREGDRLAAKVLDVLVLQGSAVCAGGGFLVACALLPQAAGIAFGLYVTGLAALTALALTLLAHLAREGGTVPDAALASRVASRRRRVFRARLRLLRRLLRRTPPEAGDGLRRPSLA